MAAAAAATAAEDAATAAEGAVMAQEANAAADPVSHGLANNVAERARDAATAARAASDAAAATADTAAAEAHQAIAEAKQGEAVTEQGNAEMYAGMVQMAQQAIDDAAAEAAALAAAKTAADAAAMAAEAAADNAEMAATKIAELTGDGSEQHMMATEAASMARAAATAARDASDMAQAAPDAATAQGHQADAETEQGTAETQYAAADELRREAQVASDTGAVQQELRDIEDAQAAAQAAADEAMTHYMAAMGKATDARTQATNARASADRAARARTDATSAADEADAAEMAAGEAEAARGRADTANSNAQAALMAAMNADTAAAAEQAQADAEAANLAATEEHTGMTGAGMAYMRAMAAAEAAETAANTHVLGLFMQANAYDIDTPIMDNSATEANEAMSVAQQRATEVASIGAAMKASAMVTDGNQRGDLGTTTAAWPGTLDDAGTPDTDESADNVLTITVDGTESDTVGDPDADPVVMPNAGTIPGVSGFMHGFDMANDELRVIAFTDREQSVVEQGATNFARYIDYGEGEGEEIATTEVSGLGESPDGGLSYPGTLTETDAGAVMGTFTCTADNCSIALDDAGTGVTAITGYTFTGTRTAKAAVTEDTNMDYLLFGLWLNEAGDGADSFGAFGGGGQEFTSGNVNPLTGTATYNGSAVGAHHKTGDAVNWFEGDASLTANFGDASDAGTIKGAISNISVNGAAAMSQEINLVSSTISGNTFNGAAVMGAQTGPGQATHAFGGTWSGGFFNNPAADAEGDDAHPGSVSGTFGVTRTDDMGTTTGADAMDDDVTESFVGAFGAHKQ
jgi:hypothetical protein